jgi:molecular chaperone GrpE
VTLHRPDYSSGAVSSSKGNTSESIDSVASASAPVGEAQREAIDSEQVQSQGAQTDDQAPAAPPAGSASSEQEQALSEPDPLEILRADLVKSRDQLLRTAADFDNYRKRSRRELVDSERQGREKVLRELLPVFDNLERAVGHADTATDATSIVDGVRLVIQQFLDTISRIGVERLQALGQPFDPSIHEAIQNLETNEFPAGTVAGYKMGDRLVRPAMVVVAKRPAADVIPPAPTNGEAPSSEPSQPPSQQEDPSRQGAGGAA